MLAQLLGVVDFEVTNKTKYVTDISNEDDIWHATKFFFLSNGLYIILWIRVK